MLIFIFDDSRWTGADTNPRNNAGQGPRGQDSSNVVLLAAQVYPEGTPGSICPKKYGHWGRNYPENVTVANFLGFSLDDKIKLAYALYSMFNLFHSYLDLLHRLKNYSLTMGLIG